MFSAPNKHFKAADRYKALVDARARTKQNSYREYHPDAHYLFSQNKIGRELGTLFSDNVTTISVDDMAKIKVGAPAVSRYHQIKRFFAEGDSPNFDDHDFPVPGYLLSVAGLMFLNLNENTSDSEFNESNYAVGSLNKKPSFENMVPDDAKIDISLP